MDTIFAQATSRGKAGVAVVRISGPLAFSAVQSLAGDVPKARQASLRKLVDQDGEVLDESLVICFEKGASFTGEQSAELQVHGSVAVVSAVLNTLAKIDGLRLAEAGEFTRRALENDCLDLVQVEGLADLVEAETESQRKQALRIFSGALGKKTDIWRKDLIRAAALIEATIDFADEEVPVDVSPEVLDLIGRVEMSLQNELNGAKMAERIRDGFEVAIIGAPNVGKSTLLNALAGRDAAITSDVAGTTRDVIEVRMDLKGLPVTLLDTAGLRETTDLVESIGINRAIDRAKSADIRVFLLSNTNELLDVSPEDQDIVLIAKDDTGSSIIPSISGETGYGVDDLISQLGDILSLRADAASSATRQRHQIAMQESLDLLEAARYELVCSNDNTELAAENLQSAIRVLDCLVGRIDVESVLGEIFSSFCIGK